MVELVETCHDSAISKKSESGIVEGEACAKDVAIVGVVEGIKSP